MTPQQQEIQRQIDLIKSQLTPLQTQLSQAQGLGYKDTATMESLGLSPEISYGAGGGMQAPRTTGTSTLVAPKTQAEINAENAQKAAYTAGGITYDANGNMVFNEPDLGDINAKTLEGFQSQIDSLNKYYAEEKAKVLKQQQDITQRQLGSQRAILGSAGMLGQVSGIGQQEELRTQRLGEEESAVGAVESKRQYELEGIYSKARSDAQAIYNTKYQSYMGTTEEIINAPAKEKEMRKTAVSEAVKKAIAGNLDLATLNVSGLAKILGVSEGEIKAEYKDQKGLLEEAQTKADLEMEKTLTGIDYQKAQTAKIDYEMKNPDVKTTVQEINGRMIMFNSQTGETIRDLGVITPKEGGVGGTTVSKDAQAKIDDSNYVLNAMDSLVSLWDKVPDNYKGYLQGKVSSAVGAKKLSKEVAEFESAKSLVGMALTRLFEKGVISDKDREFYLSQMPNLSQSSLEIAKTSADAIKEQLRQKVKALQGNVEQEGVNNDPLGIRQ